MGIRLSQAEIKRRLTKEYGLKNLKITGEKAQILKDKEKKALGRVEAIREISKELSKYKDPRTKERILGKKFGLTPSKRSKVLGPLSDELKGKDPKLVEKEIKTRIAIGKASARLAGGSRENPEMTKEGIISRVHGGEKTSEEIGIKRQAGEVHAADDYTGETPAVSAGPGQGPLTEGSIEGRPGMMPVGGGAADNYPGANKGKLPSTSRLGDPLAGRNTGPGKLPGSRLPKGNSFLRNLK